MASCVDEQLADHVLLKSLIDSVAAHVLPCLSSRPLTHCAPIPRPPLHPQPFVIVGGGRVGQALADMGAGADLMVRRGEAVPADAPAGPIVVCTRNDDLQAVVDATPAERRKGAEAGRICGWGLGCVVHPWRSL